MTEKQETGDVVKVSLKLTFFKLIGGLEIVGLIDLDDKNDKIVSIKSPLALERTDTGAGEYIGFETVVPLQLTAEIKIARRNIIIEDDIISPAMTNLYLTNIPLISENIANMQDRMIHRRKKAETTLRTTLN
jgi:hypothetical protein